MNAGYNRLSLVLGTLGLLLYIVGSATVGCGESPLALARIAIAAFLGGTVLLVVGLALYAKAKRRHWAWGFVGLLSLPGFLVLGLLEDRSL